MANPLDQLGLGAQPEKGQHPLRCLRVEGDATIFLQEQGGTLAGCIVSIALVALVRSHREIYWMVLPVVVFAAAYLSTAVGLLAGQAAFTVFVVVLLNILSPLGYRAGVMRLRYIAAGGAISLFLGFVYPPSGELRRNV
jgi:uncharacterized membrane protein YccC